LRPPTWRKASVSTILLDAEPKRELPDYALFVTEKPAPELALDLAQSVSITTDAHYGICMESPADLNHAVNRLQSAGIAMSIEREQICCYASQSKVGTVDPTGRRWEVYAVHAEADERGAADAACRIDAEGSHSSCCAA
jgi:hypothetical protein